MDFLSISPLEIQATDPAPERNVMTSLSRWRKHSKDLIILGFVWEIMGAIFGLVVLIFAVVGVGPATTLDRVVSVAGTLGLSGVVVWAIHDARRRRRRSLLKGKAGARG